ncbi:MAG: RDD family protein [Bdellovibrionaceae bacterium]|nr:RDD family protein [Pseudobdellovibrionaceae bacterium]
MAYASFWRRFGGTFVDGIICGLIGLVFYFLTRGSAFGIVFGLLYTTLFESSTLQATPGKALLGMHITDLQGQRITFKAAFIRYLMRFVSSVVFLIGFLIQPFTEKKQALHDIVAGTLVVMGEIPSQNYMQAWYNQLLQVLGMVDKVPPGFASEVNVTTPATSAPLKTEPSDLAGLYDLFQKGILTEEEYNRKRAEILKRL